MSTISFIVRPLEARRFHVSSSTGSKREHLVDLDENHGCGKCGCEDHQYRVQPELDRQPAEVRMCKHVRAAHAYEEIMKSQPPPTNDALPDS